MRRPALALLGALAIAACASGGADTSAASTTAAAPRRQSNVITADEIAEVNVGNAYDLVQRLRPAYLRARGKSANTQPQYAAVYVDGIRRGSIEALRGVTASSILSITYLSGPEATTRYGIDHEGGAILITLK